MTGVPTAPPVSFAALVLAGGGGRRLGGVDKPSVEVDGAALLAAPVAAAAGADPLLVVGPPRPGVRTVREDPPGGGPVAAIAAGLAHVTGPVTVLLAGDLPFVDAATVRRLLNLLTSSLPSAAGPAGAVLVDPEGWDQLLLSAWWTVRLRSAIAAVDPAGASVRRTLGGLPILRLPADPAGRPVWFDVDTPAELERARAQSRRWR